MKIRISDLTFQKITFFDLYNPRADKDGYVTEWVARNGYNNAVAFGRTKRDCTEDARAYVRRVNNGI